MEINSNNAPENMPSQNETSFLITIFQVLRLFQGV